MIVNCIVQARMGSKRFPGKVMAEVAGKPLIGHLLDRIKDADVDRIIVAVPFETDQSLITYVDSRKDIRLVIDPGEQNDVAGRFCKALAQFPCDAFIRVCADSPLISKDYVDFAANRLRDEAGYIHTSAGWPGTQVQGIKTALFLAFVDEFDEYDREHVLSFFTRKWSMVVDSPDDLERIRLLLEDKMDMREWMQQALPA